MAQDLAGFSFLIVEDEPLVALDIQSILQSLGAASIRVCNTAAEARQALKSAPPNAVLLDLVIGGRTIFDLAKELVEAGVKVMFVTGYAPAIPPEFQHLTVVEKPFDPEGLGAAVKRLLAP